MTTLKSNTESERKVNAGRECTVQSIMRTNHCSHLRHMFRVFTQRLKNASLCSRPLDAAHKTARIKRLASSEVPTAARNAHTETPATRTVDGCQPGEPPTEPGVRGGRASRPHRSPPQRRDMHFACT